MKKYLLAILMSCLVLFSACSSSTDEDIETEDPVETVEPSAEPTVEPTVEPTEEPIVYTNPLTGEVVDEDMSLMRTWAIMINNIEQALPQHGVSEAEIIYEIPAEGGVTRMMAIFTDISDIEAIGSMRSLRPYYADIGLSYGSIIVHAGGSDAAYTELSLYDADAIDGVLGTHAAELFYRDSVRISTVGYEHSLFTTGEMMLEYAELEGFSTTNETPVNYEMTFSENAVDQCTDVADYIKIWFNTTKSTSFTYDEDTGLYTGYEYGIRYVDGNTEENMTFTNVIALVTEISVLDSVGRLDVELTGSGTGYFMTGGMRTTIIWTRESDTSPFIFYLEDGTRLNYGIGTTYIAIMDDDYTSVVFEK